MAKQCGDCGVFMRVARNPAGEFWLCTNCESDDELIREVQAIVNELGLKREPTAAYAFGLADAIDFEDLFTTTKGADVVAAACVYVGSIIADEKITQPEVADAAGVSVTSIRDTHSTVYEGATVETDDGPVTFADHYGPIEGGEKNPGQPHPWFDIGGWRDHLSKNHSRDALKSAASHVRRFAIWYNGDGTPTEGDVRAWLEYLVEEGFAPATIEGRYNALRNYLEWADAGVDLSDIDINEYIASAWENRVAS